ncbi:MAG: DUF45 domain-containing protein [bacterium]|nr:DUF45 domain-containing protein [bacterium]
MPNSKKVLTFAGENIEYSLARRRRSRRLSVAIRSDATVRVSAPLWLSHYKIEDFLGERAGWILEKIRHSQKIGKTVKIGGGRRDYLRYREQARALIVAKIKTINANSEFIFNKMAIKNHKSRWGSCSKKGNLNFNYKVVHLADHLVEYIVAHELCHLREFNHSRDFWKLVGGIVPNYRACIRELKSKRS